jgi:TolB-like protein/DNA-binding winged helix-turn-helix (wHTH) protein/Tfp pilus assembly protein PilF
MPASLHKFGDFELDLARFELRRNGELLKLERIPMELLQLLLEKNGEIVTRQEIVERLWGKDVFVDTEHGINTAVRKIRAALRDDIDRPRFIQTVSGKGYRFIGDRANGNGNSSVAAIENLPPAESQIVSAPPAQPITPSHKIPGRLAAIALSLLLIAGLLLGLNVAGLRDKLFAPHRAHTIQSLAVLPLANLSGDPAQDYFADGMTDELITMLAKNTSLRLVSRTSAMRFKGVQRPVKDIARELGVDDILEGSIERSGNRVHMTVQLIHAPSDTHLWAESYDRSLSEAFSLPSELSRTIAREVNTAISPAKPRPPINPEAHDAYMRGRYFWFNGNTRRSQEFFQQAIQLQPDYAAAWSGLADSYTLLAVDGQVPPQTVMAKAGEAARKAIELDGSLSDAHKARAALYLFDTWEWQSAEAESRRALELDPNNAEAHHLYSYVLFVTQRLEEALQEQKRATSLDYSLRPWALGRAYIHLRQFDDAIKELRMLAESQSNKSWVRYQLSQAYWLKGMYKESEQELESALRLGSDPKMADAYHRAFVRNGEKGAAQVGVVELKARARKKYISPWDMAFECALLGDVDKEETLKYLEAAYQARSPWLVFVQNEPVFDFLHSDPRYRALVNKIGLPPAY